MNNITIPALLLGIVMIAGAFAFMPVQEASTVHTSAAGNNLLEIVTATTTDINADDELRITSNGPYAVRGLTCTFTDADTTEDFPVFTTVVDGAAGTSTANPGVATAAGLAVKMLTDGTDYVSDGGADSVIFDVGTPAAAGNDNADDTVACVFIIEAAAGVTLSAAWTAV